MLVNRWCLNSLGYSPEELLGSNLLDTFHSESSKSMLKCLLDVEATADNPCSLSATAKRKGAGSVRVELVSTLIAHAQSREQKQFMVQVLMKDGRHAADPAATAVYRSDEESQRKRIFLETILQTSSQAVIIADVAGTMKLVNTTFEQMFGFQEQEVLGKNLKMLMPDRFARCHDGTATKFWSLNFHSHTRRIYEESI